MLFLVLDEAGKKHYEKQILAMLNAGDREFIPPLSARCSTIQKELTCINSNPKGIASYCREMLEQEVLCATEGEELLGFVSYRLDFSSDVISSDTYPNLYISTLILKPEARGRGLTKKMYCHLFRELYPHRNIFTRTWSTNVAHIRILESFGFSLFCRNKNDRGEGIDTVYFRKEPRINGV